MLGYTWHWRKTTAKTANIKYVYTLSSLISPFLLFSFPVFKGFQWIKKLIGHKIFNLDLSAKNTQNSFLRTSVYRSCLPLSLFLKDIALIIYNNIIFLSIFLSLVYFSLSRLRSAVDSFCSSADYILSVCWSWSWLSSAFFGRFVMLNRRRSS